jgi:hypothetical protein
LEEAEKLTEKASKSQEEDGSLKAFEANWDRMMDLILYMDDYPKGKGEQKSKDLATKIHAGKLAMKRLAKELLQSEDSEVIDSASAVVQEANKAASRVS